jgi:hypothetical protein
MLLVSRAVGARGRADPSTPLYLHRAGTEKAVVIIGRNADSSTRARDGAQCVSRYWMIEPPESSPEVPGKR